MSYNEPITHHYPRTMWVHSSANILHTHINNPPTSPPIDTPTLTAPHHLLPCEHDRCTLYASANMCRGSIISRALFYPVCKIFNHAAKHTHHIEYELKSCPCLRLSLAQWTYITNTQTDIIPTATILHTFWRYLAQNI